MLSLRVQEFPVQLQPAPVMDSNVKPAGNISVTVTVPVVIMALEAFETVTV